MTRRSGKRSGGRLLRAVERAILGVGMTLVAFVVERKLLKGLREGGIKKKRPLAEELEQVVDVSPSGEHARPKG